MAWIGFVVVVICFIAFLYYILVIGNIIINGTTEIVVDTVDKGIDKSKKAVKSPKTSKALSDIKAHVFKPASFIESFHFIDFVQEHGKNIRLYSHVNGVTGKLFHTLEITDDNGKTTSVRFHASLGELSAEELKSKKDKLFVGKRALDRRWYLYDINYNDNSWEEVDLGEYK